jgi:hypothetical protein
MSACNHALLTQGASWTAAYHLQLTVAAVARPVRGSVGAPGVLAAARSWWLLAQTASAQRSVQPLSRGRALSPWSTRPAGTPRRRPPVCPAGGVHPSGFGVRDPAVRCPVTWAGRPEGPASGRLLSTRPVSSRPLSCRAVSSRLVSAPVGPDASVSSHSGGGGGDQVELAGDRDHRDGWGPVAAGPSTARSTVAEAGTRATLPTSRWSVEGGWRTRATGLGAGRDGRACPPSDQAGQAGARSALAGGCALGTGAGCSARWPHAAWRPSSGWVLDHAVWSSPSLTAGWADPEGPGEVPAGMGVRPQRGPSRQRAGSARCWQRSDLRCWCGGPART